jgi:hypothetical protein
LALGSIGARLQRNERGELELVCYADACAMSADGFSA